MTTTAPTSARPDAHPDPTSTTTGPPGPNRRGGYLVPACTAVVIALYVTSALLSAGSTKGSDFHRREAAAIADGHLDIRPVPRALRSLPDPYDAGANLRTRVDDDVQDLAYRNGRLYSAHGLTLPVLLLPSELVLGTAPPNWVITLAGGCAGFLAGVAALRRLRRRFMPGLPDWAAATTVLAFGLCGPTWVLMSTGNGYEAAIATAFAMTMGGAALLLRATGEPPRLRRPSAAAGSTLLALAVGARPTAIVAVAFVAVSTVWVLASRRRWTDPTTRSRVVGDASALVVPYGSILCALAVVNVVRFGSPIEFGFGYQLSVWNMTTYPMGRIGYLGPNLADYLVALPRLAGRFPWVRLRPMIGGNRPDVHTAEPVVGLLFLAPVVVVGFAALTRTFGSMRRHAAALAVTTASAATVGAATLVVVSLPFNTSTLRYSVDGAPLLVLAACVGWAWARNRSSDPDRTRALDVAWTASLVAGIVVSALVQVRV